MSFTRRRFLGTVVVTASATALPAQARGRRLPFEVSPANFPQSVASGDPRPHSVVLWTRALDPDHPHAPSRLLLEVARDPKFLRRVVVAPVKAEPGNDHCLRVRVEGLKADRHYYYRFLFLSGRRRPVLSRTGRTRTAPAAWSARDVKFAVASCQDYIGRFYNSYLRLLADDCDDLDFVVHLGDYIYETTGDPSFQTPSPERAIEFEDTAGAIPLGAGEETFFAAASLDNYRQLHRTYRADPVLQQVNERFPVINIWDDHEFSNDNFGDVATYTNGRQDEQDTTRKRNAERAWYEYTPIDDGRYIFRSRWVRTRELDPAEASLFPDTRIYRAFRFGRTLDLLLTDTRTFRPDHLIPEDAFPGTIVADQPTLEFALGPLFPLFAGSLSPYVDFAALDPATQQAPLTAFVTGAYQQAGETDSARAQQRAVAALTGNLDVVYLNLLIQTAGAAGLSIPPIDPTGLPVGLSYLLVGKQDLFSSLGSRNLTVQPTFDLLAQIASGATREDVLGAEQEQALKARLQSSDTTWKVVGSSVSLTSMVLDLTVDPFDPALGLSAQARTALATLGQIPELAPLLQRLYLSVDQWDGFPSKRKELVDFYRTNASGVVGIAGDIHASFATNHSNAAGTVFEFTGPAISSNTFQGEVRETVSSLGLDDVPGIDAFVEEFGLLLDARITAQENPLVDQAIAFNEIGKNGVLVVTASAEAIKGTYHLLPAEQAQSSLYDDPEGALALFETRSFVGRPDGTLEEA